ncbi:hypothetical protein [Bradyrhizobium canariense]|uniref:hypothetical protein n=1 Tax=Bradyrhizobium canariense TaxID=255045 RepID=UPI001FD87B35|nr:hypothetical protein [Bradyrhizobium canariense]
MAAIGDLLIARPAKKSNPDLADVVRIVQGTDVTFCNLETNILGVQSKGTP